MSAVSPVLMSILYFSLIRIYNLKCILEPTRGWRYFFPVFQEFIVILRVCAEEGLKSTDMKSVININLLWIFIKWCSSCHSAVTTKLPASKEALLSRKRKILCRNNNTRWWFLCLNRNVKQKNLSICCILGIYNVF